jgi:hypothetical protein
MKKGDIKMETTPMHYIISFVYFKRAPSQQFALMHPKRSKVIRPTAVVRVIARQIQRQVSVRHNSYVTALQISRANCTPGFGMLTASTPQVQLT